MSADDDLSRLSLTDLFREEARTQSQVLSDGLLALEHAPNDVAMLERCMRAAHSLKGAARIVGLQSGVDVAHVMEDCFVQAQHGELELTPTHIDILLKGVDLLTRIGGERDVSSDEAHAFVDELTSVRLRLLDAAETPQIPPAATSDEEPPPQGSEAVPQTTATVPATAAVPTHPRDVAIARALRVDADRLNRLLSLSGEALVESRWLKPFSASMLRVKRLQRDAAKALAAVSPEGLDARSAAAFDEVHRLLGTAQEMLATRLDELEAYDRRTGNLAQQLYDEALASRMRPFGDCTANYARMVRDLGRALGKEVRLEIVGETTRVDRDILEMLDAPLGHLLRNAVDHGAEKPDVRRLRGKRDEAVIVLEARHSAGMLQISVSDDGAGIDLAALRATVVRRGVATEVIAAHLSDAELLEFLFLPGFSMRDTVTDVSGRGVGLDAVADMVKQVRGTVRVFSEVDRGTRFQLQLPLTLSVIRSLLVGVGGEPYAFPLAYVRRTLTLDPARIESLEGRQHFAFEGRQVGLVTARQLLGAGDDAHIHGDVIPIVVIGGDGNNLYGLMVDDFRGERMLVVQPLDTRLGKIQDIAAGALLENGDPVLIVDVDDLIHSLDRLAADGRVHRISRATTAPTQRVKRILVVDDSLTVRELERKLLSARGYDVSIAVDGMEAWNTLYAESFDLVVTDIDMPRMDGIELVTLIKREARLAALPVMIVSYKDREEDRRRGLDAGADYYLAKGSFHDQVLLDAVHDLIGGAHA